MLIITEAHQSFVQTIKDCGSDHTWLLIRCHVSFFFANLVSSKLKVTNYSLLNLLRWASFQEQTSDNLTLSCAILNKQKKLFKAIQKLIVTLNQNLFHSLFSLIVTNARSVIKYIKMNRSRFWRVICSFLLVWTQIWGMSIKGRKLGQFTKKYQKGKSALSWYTSD